MSVDRKHKGKLVKRTEGNLLFSQKADFASEVLVLEFGVVVAADVGVVKGVVVQTGQRGLVGRFWAQKRP